MIRRLYVDVDGVILSHRPGGGPIGMSLKEHIDEFFKWATSNFDCYWLTGWATHGNRQLIDTILLPHLPEEAKLIDVAIWSNLKTDAIKNGESLWCDDELLKPEREYLEENGWFNNFILVDPNEPSLKHLIQKIKQRVSEIDGSN